MSARVLIIAVLALSCGGTPGYRVRAAALADAGDIEAAIEELRVGLAEHPRDAAAHAALARLQDRAGRPGAALRHFERAAAHGDLSGDDRERLAMLHVERARARLALGDGGAWRDLEQARGRAAIDDALWAEAYRAGALAALAEGDADDLLRELARVAPTDPRLAALDPEVADVAALGEAARWAWDGGARRAGRDLLAVYVDRGGRAPDLVRRWIQAEQWWHGTGAELSPLLVDEWIRGGGDACLVAGAPSDFDCAARARATPELWARARRLRWRTDDPHLAGVFVALALRQWATEGASAGWLSLIVDRVDVDAVTDPPVFAAPTLHRERMDLDAAERALDAAIEAAPGMAPHERAVVMAEAAIQGRGVAEVALAGPVPDYAWIAPAAAARAAGDSALELERLEQAGPHVFRYLAGHGELALLVGHFGKGAQGRRFRAALERWRAVMTPDAAADPPLPFGQPDPVRVAADVGLADRESIDGLVAVARAYRRDPAYGFRRADDYVDEQVAAGARAPAVIELLLRLGEPAEALRRAEALLETSPRHPRYLMLAGRAAAAAGDVERADLHFVAAAARSGDPGATNLAAARAYRALDREVAALGAGRRALEHTAPGEDQDVLLLLAGAMTRLGRTDDAARTLRRYRRRVAEVAPYDDHRARMSDRDLAAVVAAQPTEAALALALGEPDALARAAAWSSGHVALRAKLGRTGELLAIALTADGARRDAALEALRDIDLSSARTDLRRRPAPRTPR